MIRTRTSLGKYRIEAKLAEGGFAVVYRARDTIEGIRVALKLPHAHLVDDESLKSFRQEARLSGRLDHPNILPIKDAEFINGRFVIVYRLGEKTLADRLRSRISFRRALEYTEQMLDAVGYAHGKGILHCDLKPENFIVFEGDRLRLTDFGIARVARRTVDASGSGTVGYQAPEQAMGKPSLRSDVFSLGLVIYRMVSGKLPEWPFDWPPPGFDRLRGKAHPDFIGFLRRSIELQPAKRFRDASQMLAAFRRLKPRLLSHYARSPPRRAAGPSRLDWQKVRRRQFQRRYGRELETGFSCHRCSGPVSEAMAFCPWCGQHRRQHRGDTRFPARCRRCERGMKLDWRYCPWCYGPGVEPLSQRPYPDKRYRVACGNPRCTRKVLLPFMRYCPWCHRKVRKPWTIEGSRKRCGSCGWGVLEEFWNFCPWCGKALGDR